MRQGPYLAIQGFPRELSLEYSRKGNSDRSEQPNYELVIRGLEPHSDEASIRAAFSYVVPECNIRTVKVVRDRATGRSRQYGFVEFMTVEQATLALHKCSVLHVDNAPVRLCFAKRAPSRESEIDRMLEALVHPEPQRTERSEEFDPNEYSAALAVAAGAEAALRSRTHTAPPAQQTPSQQQQLTMEGISEILMLYYQNWDSCTQEQRDYYTQWAPVVWSATAAAPRAPEQPQHQPPDAQLPPRSEEPPQAEVAEAPKEEKPTVQQPAPPKPQAEVIFKAPVRNTPAVTISAAPSVNLRAAEQSRKIQQETAELERKVRKLEEELKEAEMRRSGVSHPKAGTDSAKPKPEVRPKPQAKPAPTAEQAKPQPSFSFPVTSRFLLNSKIDVGTLNPVTVPLSAVSSMEEYAAREEDHMISVSRISAGHRNRPGPPAEPMLDNPVASVQRAPEPSFSPAHSIPTPQPAAPTTGRRLIFTEGGPRATLPAATLAPAPATAPVVAQIPEQKHKDRDGFAVPPMLRRP
eukprot:TRINITY_DN11538_c0_g1_i2.p1 TRINITY_DN11538_c0_g1~~TRINITY_DN11538_c0_g1_i2.p1  ORF type:complete len:521 (-),score=69.48 TRINITY_DN11538_c0_g1_i2:16-1578(-)